MMPYIETGKLASTPADHAQWEVEHKLRGESNGPRKFGDMTVNKDSRLTKIILWVAGLSSVLIAAAAVAAVSRFFQMGDTLVRVESKVDLANQVQTIQFSQMDRRMGSLENRVGAIEQRQIDAQNLRARP